MASDQGPAEIPDWSFAATRRRQLHAGIALSPTERIAWLEEMLDELLPLLGQARQKREHGHLDPAAHREP